MKPWKPLLIAASVFPLAVSGAHADQFVRMVSGPSGGSWYPLGAKIMQVFDEEIDGITTSNTSGGGISNVLSVNAGDAEFFRALAGMALPEWALGDAAAEMRDRNDAGWRTILGDHFAPFVDSQQQENDHV